MSLLFDLVLLFIVLGGMFLGFSQGFVRQAINVLGMFFGLIFASHFYNSYTRWAMRTLGSGDSAGRNTILFFIIFLLIWLFIVVGAYFAFRNNPRFLTNSIDRILGLALGAISGIVVATIIVLLLRYAVIVPWPQNNELRTGIESVVSVSSMANLFVSFVPLLGGLLDRFLPYGLPAFFTTIR